jgi:DNA-binding Lrp family transcriptional regulator
MLDRQQVIEQIKTLNELAITKKFHIIILPKEMDAVGMDMGIYRAVISSRTLFRDPKTDVVPTGELMKMLQEIAEGKEKTKYKAPIDEEADNLEKELLEIEGIKKVILQKYEVFLERAVMFEWDEIMPKVFDILERFSLMKEFKSKGGLLTSVNIPGVSGGEVN